MSIKEQELATQNPKANNSKRNIKINSEKKITFIMEGI
jgi:hypothetical protein